MSEELPNPRKDVPKAVAAQLGLGTVYAFCFAVAIFYGISDLNAVIQNGGSFPLAEVREQPLFPSHPHIHQSTITQEHALTAPDLQASH